MRARWVLSFCSCPCSWYTNMLQRMGTRTSDSSLFECLSSWAQGSHSVLLLFALLSGTIECFTAIWSRKTRWEQQKKNPLSEEVRKWEGQKSETSGLGRPMGSSRSWWCIVSPWSSLTQWHIDGNTRSHQWCETWPASGERRRAQDGAVPCLLSALRCRAAFRLTCSS